MPQELAPLPILRPLRTSLKTSELMDTVARYLGEERSRRSFERFAAESQRALEPKAPADLHMLRFSEQLLASAIGAASARLVLSLLLNRDDPTPADTQRLLDDAEQALHYNRDLLQTVLDQVDQGVAAFDRELRLICWNRLFRQHLDLPAEFGQIGISLQEILRHLAEVGLFGPGDPEALADRRIAELTRGAAALARAPSRHGPHPDARAARLRRRRAGARRHRHHRAGGERGGARRAPRRCWKSAWPSAPRT